MYDDDHDNFLETEGEYVVTFVGDYFVTTVNITTPYKDEELAIDMAHDLIESQYGWDLLATASVQATAEEKQ